LASERDSNVGTRAGGGTKESESNLLCMGKTGEHGEDTFLQLRKGKRKK